VISFVFAARAFHDAEIFIMRRGRKNKKILTDFSEVFVLVIGLITGGEKPAMRFAFVAGWRL